MLALAILDIGKFRRRLALRRAHRCALGCHLYQPLCRAHHGRAAGHRVASGAALCGHRSLRARRRAGHDAAHVQNRGRPAEVLGTALFADGVLRFLLAPLSGDYADASVLFHIVTPAQAIAMLMVVLGGACWLGPSRRGGNRNRRCTMPDTATAQRARSSFPPRPPAAGWISIWSKRSPSAARACSGYCRRRRCCSKASRPKPA